VVRGPAVLRILLMHGTIRYVPWDRIADLGEEIVVSGDGSDLGPTAPGERR
jgi:hypothetical protein